MNPSLAFLGPVDHLPAEGSDFAPAGATSLEACASLFSESSLYFDVSLQGASVLTNPQEAALFQLFTLEANENSPSSAPQWADRAFSIRLQDFFPDASSFDTLSDASEPEDFVRRFLEVLGAALQDAIPDPAETVLPLIRWRAGEDGNSARIQLLALLLADDHPFQHFGDNAAGGFGFVFEDAEVRAHGVREVITAVALLGITFGSATQAEAGLFSGFGKKKETRIQRSVSSDSVHRTPAPLTRQTAASGWQDVHRDAYVNHDLLAAGSGAGKKIVIDISKQRAYLIVDNIIALDTAVSTARSGKFTPRGEFKITERVKSGKTSTIYGCSLPYWQRLDQSAIGLHVGDLPGYPASAGCIRLPESVAPILFANTASGVSVEIVDSWDPASLHQSLAQQDILVAEVVPHQSGS